MGIDRANLVRDWLAAKGNFWNETVQQASRFLLQKYMKRWQHLIPVELHRLSATLNAELVPARALKGEAILLPELGGFRILVNSSTSPARYRTSIAHELVHTLFYTAEEDERLPRRIVPQSEREEHFCFDVARHLLAPREHLDIIGVLNESDPAVIFNKLTKVLLLSRPGAARLMLADYELAKGLAGRWVRSGKEWKQEGNSATATPSLSQKEKIRLKTGVVKYLQDPEKQTLDSRILALEEKSGEGVFILITKA